MGKFVLQSKRTAWRHCFINPSTPPLLFTMLRSTRVLSSGGGRGGAPPPPPQTDQLPPQTAKLLPPPHPKCLFTLHAWGSPPATIHYICVINGSFSPKFRVLDRTLSTLTSLSTAYTNLKIII